jgi:hypothetical protein
MGTYTDHTQTDSQTPSAYKWVKVKGEQGVKGDTGVGIASVTEQYARNNNINATPTTG